MLGQRHRRSEVETGGLIAVHTLELGKPRSRASQRIVDIFHPHQERGPWSGVSRGHEAKGSLKVLVLPLRLPIRLWKTGWGWPPTVFRTPSRKQKKTGTPYQTRHPGGGHEGENHAALAVEWFPCLKAILGEEQSGLSC